EVELIAGPRRLARGDHELGERLPQPVLLEEAVERLPLVRAEGKGGRLRHDPGVQGRRLQHAGERLLPVAGGEQRPWGELPLLTEHAFEVLNRQSQLGKAEMTVDLLPVEP